MPTEIVHTVAATGGDYTTLAAWQTAQVRDLVTADEIAVAEVDGVLDNPANNLNITGWTTDATRYVIIRAKAGQECRGATSGTGFAHVRKDANWTRMMTVTQAYTSLQDLMLQNTGANGEFTVVLDGQGSNALRCTIINDSTNSSSAGTAITINGQDTFVGWCLAKRGNKSAFGFGGGNSGQTMFNCVAYNTSIGFRNAYEPDSNKHYRLYNCATIGCTTEYQSPTLYYTEALNNAGETATAADIPGTGAITSITTADFEDTASGNYQTKSGGALDGTGYNHGRSNIDILGNTVSTWPVGVNEPVAGGQTVAVGLVTETDSTLAPGAAKAKATGLSSEADSGLSLSFSKAKSFGISSESDTALAAGAGKSKAIGLSAETDTVFSVTWSRSLTVGLATEADTSFALSFSKAKSVGISSESDTALTTVATKEIATGLASEADATFALSAAKEKAVGIAQETDTPLSVTVIQDKIIEVGLVSEADATLSLTAAKAVTITQVSTLDSAAQLAFLKSLAVGIAQETDTALGVAIPVGLAIETNSVMPVSTGLALATWVYTVAAEQRSIEVAAEQRSIAIAAEARGYDVAIETRRIEV